MMDSDGLLRIFAVTILLCVLTRQVYSLECYECSSTVDEKCGEEWEFEGTEADKYKVECHNTATACKKYVNWEGPEAIVYRHCWNMTTDVSYTPSGCEEYDWTEICYCSDVNRPCNRVGHLLVSPWLMAVMTASCFVTIML